MLLGGATMLTAAVGTRFASAKEDGCEVAKTTEQLVTGEAYSYQVLPGDNLDVIGRQRDVGIADMIEAHGGNDEICEGEYVYVGKKNELAICTSLLGKDVDQMIQDMVGEADCRTCVESVDVMGLQLFADAVNPRYPLLTNVIAFNDYAVSGGYDFRVIPTGVSLVEVEEIMRGNKSTFETVCIRLYNNRKIYQADLDEQFDQ